MTGKTEDGDYLLAQTPQEWKWLLQDEGLIVLEDDDGDHVNKQVDDEMDPEHDHVGSALDNLQRLVQQVQDLQAQLESKQRQQEREDARASVWQKRRTKLLHEWHMWMPASISSRDQLQEYIRETVEPACLEYIQGRWEKHTELLKSLLQDHAQVMKVIGSKTTDKIVMLPSLLDSTARIESYDICQQINLELQYLQAFVKTHAAAPMPAFVSVAFPVPKTQWHDYDSMLSQLLEKDLILFKWWSLWNTRQHEWCTLLERLETSLSVAQQNAITAEASSDLSDLKAEIQQLRDRMEKQKVALEQEITSLFDFEDSIEIVLE
jgi:hypothetical protein